ncbi:DHH family phosphoesterase [Aquabacterium sp.]|uniref:DHH family phosphoesterase n=1 Tax=Aquabacterium sp. TaxID=1872578 RepID=UPI004037FD2B
MSTGLFTSLPGLAVAPSKADPNPLVIYHGKCPDGFGAALAAWLYFEGQGEYLGVTHGKINDVAELPALEGRAVYILDFSFDELIMQGIDERAAKLVLLDHHKSAADKLGRFQCRCGAVHFDMSQSGAMLSWKFFFPEQDVPDLIRFIQDRDLWNWAYPERAAFLSALDLEPNEFPRGAEIAAFKAEQVSEFCQRGTAMNEKFISLCKDIAQGASPLTFNGQQGVMVNCPGAFTSEVGNMLSAECGSFALLWSVSKDGTVKIGLRAVATYNAIPLAEAMGGGGHPQACGFRMGPERLPELLTGVFWADPEQRPVA